MSRGRKSLSRSASSVRSVPGRAGAQGAPVIAILPGNENERAGSGFHSLPDQLGGGQGRAGPCGSRAPGRCGSAGRRGSCSHLAAGGQPLGQPVPGFQGDEGGILRNLGGPREPLALGSRPRRTNFMLALCVSIDGWEGPVHAVHLDQVPPLREGDICPHAIWLSGGPAPESHQQSWRCAPPDLDPSTQWIPTGTFSQAARGMVRTCLSPVYPCLSSSISRESGERW